jgi:hypothetical protein
MLSMLQAHGLDAGPTQRPLMAGAASGLVAAVPALAVMLWFRSLEAPISATGTPPFIAVATCCGFLLLGGLLYGRLFQRAASDLRGGWLFGLAFGFILWMLGPIPLLQWLPDEPILRGYPAAGLLLAQLLWGLSLGLTYPIIQRRLQVHLGELKSAGGRIGPDAAVVLGMMRSFAPSRSEPS